jgi:hypothetical protein
MTNEKAKRLKDAIRRQTIEEPSGGPNGPTEAAFEVLGNALQKLDARDPNVRGAYDEFAKLGTAIVADCRELRQAADEYFGENFLLAGKGSAAMSSFSATYQRLRELVSRPSLADIHHTHHGDIVAVLDELATTHDRLAKLETENKELRAIAQQLVEQCDALPTMATDGQFVKAYLRATVLFRGLRRLLAQDESGFSSNEVAR